LPDLKSLHPNTNLRVKISCSAVVVCLFPAHIRSLRPPSRVMNVSVGRFGSFLWRGDENASSCSSCMDPLSPHAQIEDKKHEEEAPEILSLQLSPPPAGVEPRPCDTAVRCSPHVGITPIKCVCVQEDTCMHSPPAPRQRPCHEACGVAAWELTRRHLRGGRTTTTTTGETRFDARPAGRGCLCSARPCEYFTARPRPSAAGEPLPLPLDVMCVGGSGSRSRSRCVRESPRSHQCPACRWCAASCLRLRLHDQLLQSSNSASPPPSSQVGSTFR
jgi:hypothetical protein